MNHNSNWNHQELEKFLVIHEVLNEFYVFGLKDTLKLVNY